MTSSRRVATFVIVAAALWVVVAAIMVTLKIDDSLPDHNKPLVSLGLLGMCCLFLSSVVIAVGYRVLDAIRKLQDQLNAQMASAAESTTIDDYTAGYRAGAAERIAHVVPMPRR